MKLVYNTQDKPPFGDIVIFAIQQLLAIMTATLVVPVIVGHGMSPAAALFGAGIGTLVYVLITKRRSPVFLGSSFAFLGSMAAAFAGGVSVSLGYLGLIIGAIFAGLVYVVISILVRLAGVGWINKLMPPAVIGPTVTIIGLSLATNAIGDLSRGNVVIDDVALASPHITVLCGLITLFITVLVSTYAKHRTFRLMPFIIGIMSGYVLCLVVTIIGYITGIDALKITDLAAFNVLYTKGLNLLTLPDFTFVTALGGFAEITPTYIATIAVAYVPVAFVVFAEHLADHKNISSIINRDLLTDPGLSRTLLGDGLGSMAGALFGGCPNTTYGESVACVAITRNASVITIIAAAIGAIAVSFITPFVAFVNSIPSCVMGGVCMALYGFIAVSGLKMIKNVDLEQNRYLFTVSTILIAGIGGLTLTFGKITLTSVATALILGIIVNWMLSKKEDPGESKE